MFYAHKMFSNTHDLLFSSSVQISFQLPWLVLYSLTFLWFQRGTLRQDSHCRPKQSLGMSFNLDDWNTIDAVSSRARSSDNRPVKVPKRKPQVHSGSAPLVPNNRITFYQVCSLPLSYARHTIGLSLLPTHTLFATITATLRVWSTFNSAGSDRQSCRPNSYAWRWYQLTDRGGESWTPDFLVSQDLGRSIVESRVIIFSRGWW